MKPIIIILSILVLSSCSSSGSETYRNIDVQHDLVILRKEYYTSYGKFYIFNGASSEWYYVSDEGLYHRTNIGDTLRGINLYIYNYQYGKSMTKQDSMQQQSILSTGAAIGAQ